MDAQRLQRHLARVRGLKPWYFLVLAVLAGLLAVGGLRANNLRMIELRNALYVADEQAGDVEGALRALREHVHGHMNTNLVSGTNGVRPPIQLKYTYERLVREQQARTNTNSELYTEAQQYCERTIPNGVSGSARLGCIQAYVKQRDPAAAPSIPKNLYQFDFVSPRWSPDLAGWSIAVAVGSVGVAIGLGLYQAILRRLIRRHA